MELPFAVIQGTNRSCFQPLGDAMVVEGVVADAPGNLAVDLLLTVLQCLAFDARVLHVIFADRAGVYVNIPGPHCDCVPFLNGENVVVFGFVCDC